MGDAYLLQDLYLPKNKKVITSDVKALRCTICNEDLDGASITAKERDGKTVFLCSKHVNSGCVPGDEG